jgi:hypothetical protein
MELLRRGNSFKEIHETSMNPTSSRSHTIFQIVLEVNSFSGKQRITSTSKLMFVDLAGSERISKSHSQGDRLYVLLRM